MARNPQVKATAPRKQPRKSSTSFFAKPEWGADGRDYNLTDAAAIIHYLTGYSYNTIRHYLSSGELSRAQSYEIQDACSLLERLNIQLTIR